MCLIGSLVLKYRCIELQEFVLNVEEAKVYLCTHKSCSVLNVYIQLTTSTLDIYIFHRMQA
jgi:hypothetical protein